jgi:hypothetical protein
LVDAAFEQVFTMDPSMVYAPFLAMVTEIAEVNCPRVNERAGGRIDLDGDCTTADGTRLIMEGVRYDVKPPQTNPGGVTIAVDGWLSGDALVIRPNGDRWEMSHLIVSDERQLANGVRRFEGRLIGTMKADQVGGWAAQRLSAALEQTWYTGPDGLTPGAYLLDGGVSGFEHPQLAGYSFKDFSLVTEDNGGLCDIEPTGSISVRAHGGAWHDIVFSGPDSFTETPDLSATDCDGCAEVFFGGESLGEFCPDISAALNWETRPW